jgi:hypothetical protein
MFSISVLVCYVYCLAAFHNYPGGRALHTLLTVVIPIDVKQFDLWTNRAHESEFCLKTKTHSSTERCLSVHIDEAAAMTGVSRFGQEPAVRIPSSHGTMEYRIAYSKQENLENYSDFDYLLTANSE